MPELPVTPDDPTQRTLDLLREEWTAPLRAEVERLREALHMAAAEFARQGDHGWAGECREAADA